MTMASGDKSCVLQHNARLQGHNMGLYRCIFTQFFHLYTPYTSSACLLLFKVAKPERETRFNSVQTPNPRVWKSSGFGIPTRDKI